MTQSRTNAEFARENEEFADDIEINYEDKGDWVVTVRFYSLVHYVEERLKAHDYNSRSHGDRKKNIRDCRQIDNSVRKLYRFFEDLSKDARYECIPLTDEDVEQSEQWLERGKSILGYTDESRSYKYST